MDTDLDMDPAEAAAIEERLYSQFHHALKKSSNPESTFVTIGNNVPSRLVSKTSVVNNATNVSPFPSKKRYWASAEGYQRGGPPSVFQHNRFASKEVPPKETSGREEEVSNTPPKRVVFTPYQSLLGNQNGHENNRNAVPLDVENSVSRNDYTNSRNGALMTNTPKPAKQNLQKKIPKRSLLQSSQHPVKKKLSSLVSLIEKHAGQHRKCRLESKKAKACMVRKRNAERIVAKINLASSDEECESSSKSTDPSSKSNNRSYKHDDDDDNDDEIEVVELPPAPKICIDCSDEEMTQDSFALPQSKTSEKKVPKARVVNSPRCLSPSNSSIMSDDFIGLHDRSRLNDSFVESIPNDDELECSLERHAGGYKAGSDKPSLTPREQRAPSISSEETFTSSDTTDQEKRLQKSHILNKPKALAPHGNRTENAAGSKAATKEDQQSNTSLSRTNNPKQNKTSAEEPTAASSNASKSGEMESRRKCKSPISMALELARKQFETGNRASSARSAKRKSKNDQASDTSKTQLPETDQSPSAGGKDSVISSKNKAKQIAKVPKLPDLDIDSLYQSVSAKSKPNESTDHLRCSAESASSESDYDFEIAMPDENSPTETNQSCEKLDERKSSEESLLKDAPEEELDNISLSESDYDENFDQATKSTPKAAKEGRKRSGRKRKQYNSETYSDEDFASMLTYIVQAMSDSDSEEEEDPEEQEGKLEKKKQRKPEEPLQQDNQRESQKEKQAEPGMMEMESKQRRQSRHDQDREKQAEPETETEKKKQKRQINKPEQQEEQMKQQHKQEGVKTVENRQEIRQTEAKEQEKHVKRLADDLVISSTTITTSSPKRDYGPNCDGPSAKKVKQSENLNAKEPLTARHVAADADIEIVEDVTPSGHRTPHLPSSSRHSDPEAEQKLPDCAWNEEMKLFYNHVWMDEDFNLSSVLKKMPRDKSQWKIAQKDLYPDRPKKEIICNNCGDRGHMRNSCRNRPKPRVCYMCGETGHQEPRCPNTICLNCGSRTRSFVRECRMCTRDINSICRLCNVRGHLARACPDNWRRYHSTTEDNVPLNRQYRVNRNARQCCICRKLGHPAHKCMAAYRIFGQAIPTVEIQSYQPTYPCVAQRRVPPEDRRLPRYNLFSDNASSCELNLHELAANANGFYYRFSKSVGLLPKHKQLMVGTVEQEVRAGYLPYEVPSPSTTSSFVCESSSTRPDENEAKVVRSFSPPHTIGMKKECENRPLPATEDAEACVPLLLEIGEESNPVPVEDHEDSSNEKLTARDDGTPSVPNTAPEEENAPLPDFIPLCSETNVALSSEPPLNDGNDDDDAVDVAALNTTATPSEGRVYLSKPHAKKLLSAQGNEFLNAAAQNHSLKLSISFESFGNVLLLNGQSHAQDLFHEELKRFLDASDTAQTNERCALANNVPRTAKKALKFIIDNLQMLTEPQRSVQELFQSYQSSLKRGLNKKTQEKIRRSLNIALFGHFGLRDGAKHLEALCVKMQQFLGKKSLDYLLLPNQRSEIQESSMYIFSSYDHRDYYQIVKEYDTLRLGSKKKRVQETLTPGQVFLQQVDANCKSNGLSDLLLNTSDQLLVDTDRLNTLDRATCDYQDNQTIERTMAFAGDKRFRGKREETYSYNESLLGQCHKLVKNLHHKEAQRLMRVLSTYGRKTSTEVILNMLTMLQGMQPHTFRR